MNIAGLSFLRIIPAFTVPLFYNSCTVEENQKIQPIQESSAQLSRVATEGSHQLEDGSIFEGHLAMGLPQGFGTKTYQNEDVYQGHFNKGFAHGYGIMRYKSLPQVDRYFGNWANSRREGHGTLVMKDGSEMVGHWQKDELVYGDFSVPEGAKYFGKWDGNLLIDGVYESSSGERFFGTFNKQGDFLFGSLLLSDGSIYHGSFENAQFHGQGIHELINGSVYSGQFVFGKKSGIGLLKEADGSSYHGEFKEDLPDGYGVQSDVSGVRYAGSWSMGVRHGAGSLDFGDGTFFSGEFENGLATSGKYDWGDGRVTESYQDDEGNWKDL